MHRRSASGTATDGHPDLGSLRKRENIHAAAPPLPLPLRSYSYAGSSRFRTEAEAPSANRAATVTHSGGQSLSEDQIVCQSRLYDAFELQELEQHLDRKLNLHNHRKIRSFSSLNSSQAAIDYSRRSQSLLSVSSTPNDRPSPAADHPRQHTSCRTCSLCNTGARNASLGSVIKDPGLPASKESLITAANNIPVDHLQAESSCTCNQPLQEENGTCSYTSRSYSMPRSHCHGRPARPAHPQEQEALQDLQMRDADQYTISSTAKSNVIQVHKKSRAKRSRWPLFRSLFRSLQAIHKKQDNKLIMQEDMSSTSTKMNFLGHRQNKEYHHHHNIVHYHHVHHHHHHHVVNGVHFEEIDWPLSPTQI